MWFWLSLGALVCWSASDLFSKMGCQYSNDKYSHLKMIIAVGVVMGVHACYQICFQNVVISFDVIFTYLPVSLLYVLSMALGYLGLRYIELSISSPICNSSGALVAVLCLVTGSVEAISTKQVIGIVFVCVGVIGVGVAEALEDDISRSIRQRSSSVKYEKSWLALGIPIGYCLLDALGTFGDSIVLQKLPEESANAAYEITFVFCALIAFIYIKLIKKQSFVFKSEVPKYAGAIFETLGQFAYIFAIGDTSHVALAAPMISAYCLLSVVWGHIFLKEKLTYRHYIAIVSAVVGIVLLSD